MVDQPISDLLLSEHVRQYETALAKLRAFNAELVKKQNELAKLEGGNNER